MSAVVAVAAARWHEVHESLQALALERARSDFELGRLLLEALRESVHQRLGFGSFTEYIERLFGLSPRQTCERLRVASALDELPRLGTALRAGELSWSAARELTRVAVAETEAAWLTAAQGRTARDIERIVGGRQPGDRPSDPPDPLLQRHVLRFEVTAEVLAIWREAVAELKRRTAPGEPLGEQDALLLMARAVLGGPKDEGRSSYQVAMTICERCGQGYQQSRGEVIAVDPAVTEMALCDAQFIDGPKPDAHPPAGQPRAHAGACGRHSEPHGPSPHTQLGACEPPHTHVGNCSERARAHQSVRPRTRRAVFRRQQGRCAVPGCCNSVFLDLHHLKRRADAGGSGEDEVILLCVAHHRAAHFGALMIEGRPSTDLRFLHADGSRYGSRAAPAAVEAQTKAFGALKNLGFRESDIRLALNQVRPTVGADAPLGQVVRAALAVLT